MSDLRDVRCPACHVPLAVSKAAIAAREVIHCAACGQDLDLDGRRVAAVAADRARRQFASVSRHPQQARRYRIALAYFVPGDDTTPCVATAPGLGIGPYGLGDDPDTAVTNLKTAIAAWARHAPAIVGLPPSDAAVDAPWLDVEI